MKNSFMKVAIARRISVLPVLWKNFLFSAISMLAFNATSLAQPLNLTATQIAGNCSSNAQINATATGGTAPYQYRLTAGAAGTTYPTPWQSGTNFSGLKPGAYTVQVQDNIGANFSRNVTVTTTYVSLNLSNVTNTPNRCPLSPDGTVTATVSAGRTPYTYRLLQGATEIMPAQSANRFTAVTDGSYTVEVTDACGEIRTFASVVALNDFKWRDSKNSDNDLVNSGYGGGYPAAPFDTTKLSNIYDGPILFTCDSIAFRIFNTLGYNGNDAPARTAFRRVHIKELSSGNIVWDYRYRPSDWPGGYTSPSVRLKINTNYRFYFDDLCNDIDSADRNYNYANTDYYALSSNAQKICGGYNLVISRPSNWNTKNRYNSPYDTITIISSTLAGDTTVGKRVIENFADRGLSSATVIAGITPGHTYTVRINNTCTTYTRTIFVNAPPPLNANISVGAGACKINTAYLYINVGSFPNTPGKMAYRINSGPASFTDINGNVYPIVYPMIDSIAYSNRIGLRNFPRGTYSIDFWDQCGNTVPTITFTVTDADVLKLSGSASGNQQCAGASSITYNNIFNQRFSGTISLQRKNAGGVYTAISNSPQYNSGTLPASYTFSSLADGDYRVIIITSNATPLAAPVPANTCDTLFRQDITLAYQLPQVDTAQGFICTPGGSDGKVTLYGKKGVRPYSFQRVDGAGNPVTAYQTDSLFTGLSRGLYNFRIKDNCGNATLYALQVDTLKNATITLDKPCYKIDSSLAITADSIYNANYFWVYTPFSTGIPSFLGSSRNIFISPLNSNHFGTYELEYSMPGCSTFLFSKVHVVQCVVLPVKILSFTAEPDSKCGATFRGGIEGMAGAKAFQIQKSPDGFKWQAIKQIINVSPGTGGIHYYTEQVAGEGAEKSFYRLAVVDINNTLYYSGIVKMATTCNPPASVSYSNPAYGELSLSLSGYKGHVAFSLFNGNGQKVKSATLFNGFNAIGISSMPAGGYHFLITDSYGMRYSSKVIVVR